MAQAQQLDHLWQWLQSGPPRSGAIRDEVRVERIVSELVRLCGPEIMAAMLENPAGRVLSGLRISVLENRLRTTDRRGFIWGTVRLAPVFNDWFYRAEAENLLPLLLSLPRPVVVTMGEYLNNQQRSGLRELLYRELGNRPVLILLDREPTEQRKWLYWYLWRWEMTQPGVKRTLGRVSQYLFAAQSDTLPTNKQTGEPLDPLGPIHAKVWPRLGRELNKRGFSIKDPESKSRTARSLGVDRSTLKRYLKADIGEEPVPDGAGRVNYQFTDEDAIRSIEVVMRKRGPEPHSR